MPYGKIYYGSKADSYPANTRITYSAREHREARQDIRRAGYYIHYED